MTDRKASIETLFRAGLGAGAISAKLRIPIGEVRECIKELIRNPGVAVTEPDESADALAEVPEVPTESAPAAPITEQSEAEDVNSGQKPDKAQYGAFRNKAQQIYALAKQGKGQAEIARILGISYKLADYYLRKYRRAAIEGEDLAQSATGAQAIELRDSHDAVVDAPAAVLTCQSVTIADLREEWSTVYGCDQERAAMAARILRFLDNLAEEFRDQPELANAVARQGVSALINAYAHLKEAKAS